ncbi:MAG: hypothetical protein DRG11_06260 [Epsilonproteobacteria bacterium]|nr:MAG: hypothetical protein DRG11_06260 [Campylobacterota bacterium]
MELIYLWVDKYKNIINQGFCFSPKFECSFDGSDLTIKQIENYKFKFADNINITAIVGENGSGKSNILETIIHLYLNGLYNNSNICLVYYLKGIGYCVKNLNSSISTINNISIKNIQDDKTFLMYYDYSLTSIVFANDKIVDNSCFYKIKKDSHSPLVMQPTKAYACINRQDIDNQHMKYILNFAVLNNICLENIKQFFTPNSFKLSFKYDKIYLDKHIFDKKEQKIITDKIDIFYRPDGFVSSFNRDEMIDLSVLYIITQTLYRLRESGDQSTIKITKEYENIFLKDNGIIHILNENNIDALIKYIKANTYKSLYRSAENKIELAFKFIDYLNEQINDFSIDDSLYDINKNKKFLEYLPSWIDIELYHDDISFNDLSNGQKHLTQVIYNILYQINILKIYYKYKHINLLLDEVELGLHPNWQKEFIALLISILKTQKDFVFNIILTSHSPFILSDLPKENIIFLKEGKQTKVDIDTFGANIHTLLSHGFFMNDGLMGEFARSKIDEVINFLNDKEPKVKNINEAQNIINIIGEPIIKRQLQQMIDSKRLQKCDDIDNIKEQIKTLQDKLTIQENDTNKK